MSKPTSCGELGNGARDLRVLLVEDDIGDVGFLRSLLTRSRLAIHDLREVCSLAAALDALREEGATYDVVLLDLGLPDTSGLEGATRITEAAPNVPIIVLTGSDDDDLATRAMTQDVQDYLVKWEFDPPLLARSIRYAVERHQLHMQLKAEKERAQQASRAKGDFLANMSHEIRAPMNIVLGMADLLRAASLAPEQTEQVARLQSAGDVLMDLVDNVLDLSRIEAGRMEFLSEPFDLPALVTQVTDIVRPTAVAKGLSLTAKADKDLPIIVEGDGRRLRQVLLNLLANAIKFTEVGAVELHAAVEPDGRVTFRIKDTGPGIARERLASVFDQFAQADAGVGKKHGGFGLGLSIASNLVKLMGGTIDVESEVGVGTAFHVGLRFRDSTRTASGTMVKANLDVDKLVSALANKPSPIRLLLVDDSVDNHELLLAYVSGLPIIVRAVKSGEAAVGAFGADVFDLVLVDMHMPGMNGCETLRALREHEREIYAEPTPMLVMSADVLTETIEKAKQAGGDGFLSKPVRRNTLLDAIVRHCGDVPESEGAPPPSSAILPPMDPTIAPILPRFLANRAADCVAMRDLSASGDFARVAVLAHNLKGTGGAFGFPELSAMGGKLETLAKAGDVAEIGELLDVLSARLMRLNRALEAQAVSESVRAVAFAGRGHA